MLLTSSQIDYFRRGGGIVIDPFDPRNLGSAQYDVSLGEHYWYHGGLPRGALSNQWDEASVRATWTLGRARPAREWTRLADRLDSIRGFGPEDPLIVLEPGEFVLGHTREFVGSTSRTVTAQIRARSTVGRAGLTVALCAGWGDHGYFNRWTLEIHNFTPYAQVLVAGRRVAQVVFSATQPVDERYRSKYQGDAWLAEHPEATFGSPEHVAAVKAAWRPEDMLPRAWADREVAR